MKKYLKLFLLVCWMGVIFYLSAQPANDSTITTNVIIEIMYKLYKVLLSNKAIDHSVFVNIVFSPVRKIAHFTEFMILGIMVFININRNSKKYIFIEILFSCLYAISDEVHQLFVPGRYCSAIDILIDSSGAIFGILLTSFISKRCIKNT